jgi:hypothetical protein
MPPFTVRTFTVTAQAPMKSRELSLPFSITGSSERKSPFMLRMSNSASALLGSASTTFPLTVSMEIGEPGGS